MNTVYVMVPFFKVDNKQHIKNKAHEMLGFSSVSQSQRITIHQISSNKYALQINNFQLHFLEINRILDEFSQSQRRLEILESVLKDYDIQSQMAEDSMTDNADNMTKKMKKYKDIKEENKKLKKLLQVQLENTQKVRQETQKTMKVLREQFDALVVEIGRKQKNSVHSASQSYQNITESEVKDHQGRQKPIFSGPNSVKHTNIR